MSRVRLQMGPTIFIDRFTWLLFPLITTMVIAACLPLPFRGCTVLFMWREWYVIWNGQIPSTCYVQCPDPPVTFAAAPFLSNVTSPNDPNIWPKNTVMCPQNTWDPTTGWRWDPYLFISTSCPWTTFSRILCSRRAYLLSAPRKDGVVLWNYCLWNMYYYYNHIQYVIYIFILHGGI